MLTKKQLLAAPAMVGLLVAMSPVLAVANDDVVTFNMVVSAGAKSCLPKATATVKIIPGESADLMDVTVSGLPANTDFDFFVLQVPKAPFGVAWYQGDIQTNKDGHGHARFLGRFSIETFAVAVGSAPAPAVFNGPFPDATLNPPFNPIQMYHLGMWFNSPKDAQDAGCPATVTPFNGEHNAGIQVLNTSNFADDQGPLRKVQ